jgi:hypothetical protein
MKYQKPVNTVQNKDEFSSALMESYGKWMGGDTFQNTQPVELNLSEAPFDGMDPQSNGAEIEDTTKRKKTAKKGGYIGQESAPKNEEVEVLEREEYELDGETYVIEKVKGLDGKACWKGYKYAGTKMKGDKKVDNCVKAGFEPEGEEDLQEKAVSKAQQKFMGMVHATKKGEMKGGSKEVKKAAASMTGKEAKDFASTKHKGLPEKKVKKEEFELTEKKLDPVGREDKDIDNDGDHDKSDKYLLARRKKIGKILAMKKKS